MANCARAPSGPELMRIWQTRVFVTRSKRSTGSANVTSAYL